MMANNLTVMEDIWYDYGIGVSEGNSYASGINPAGAVQLDKDRSVINQFNGNLMLEARFLKISRLLSIWVYSISIPKEIVTRTLSMAMPKAWGVLEKRSQTI